MLHHDLHNAKKEITETCNYQKPVRNYKAITRYSLVFLGIGFISLGILSLNVQTIVLSAIASAVVGSIFLACLIFL